jgi:hypothetical protein
MPGYSDFKEMAKDAVKFTLNGSPRWRVVVMLSLVALSIAQLYAGLNRAEAGEVDSKIEAAVQPLRNDLESIKAEQRAKKREDLQDAILAAKRDQCDAVREGRSAQAWTRRIAELNDQYFRVVGQSFQMPTCSEV